MVIVVGVDAGKDGAVAAYDIDNDKILEVIDLPLDSERDLDAIKFSEFLVNYCPRLLVVEDCWQPLTLVRMVGEITAVGKLVGAEVQRVAVCTWKIEMIGHNSSNKKESIAKCQKVQPLVNLIKPRCRTPSPDRAEAVLLALYAKILYR